MVNKKWYVVTYMAEDYAYTVIDLSDEELATIRRFIGAEVVFETGSWWSTPFIQNVNNPYSTKEDALASINELNNSSCEHCTKSSCANCGRGDDDEEDYYDDKD